MGILKYNPGIILLLSEINLVWNYNGVFHWKFLLSLVLLKFGQQKKNFHKTLDEKIEF